MLFRNLCYNLAREIGCASNILSLREQALLQKGLDLNIILHLIQLKELLLQAGFARGGSQDINGILLNLHEKDLGERLTVDGQSVCEIIYGNLHAALNLFQFYDLLITEKSEFVLLALENIYRDQIAMMISSECIFSVLSLLYLRLHSVYKKHTLSVDIGAIRGHFEGVLLINDGLAIFALLD